MIAPVNSKIWREALKIYINKLTIIEAYNTNDKTRAMQGMAYPLT